MILYHRTTRQAAEQIQQQGFRDSTGSYLTSTQHSGVWLSNVPLDANDGAIGTHLFVLQSTLSDWELSEYEWVEDGKRYREFLVPAEVVNSRMTIASVEVEPLLEF
jgi:hypothetical protein